MDKSPERRLDSIVEALRDEYIALLVDLVRCPSVLGHELPAQERLLSHVRSMGLEAELWDLDPAALQADPRFIRVERDYANRPNLTASLAPSGSGGCSLLFNTHIDVVAPGPLERWQHDPWAGDIEGGRMVGRGSLDMKAGIVQALWAIRAVQLAEVALRGPVLFESVIEEECSGNGTLAARLHAQGDAAGGRAGTRTRPYAGARPDAAVLPEPTDLGAKIATTGTMWVGVEVGGKPSYVGRAGEYVNAVDKAAFMIARLGSIADEINSSLHHPAYQGLERPFTFSVGTVQGGDWPSSVPLACRFVCRLSFPPGVPVRAIQDLVERHIRAVAAQDPWLAEHPPRVTYPGYLAEGWATDAHTPLLQALEACHRNVLGQELARGVTFGTADARYFGPETQAVYYGPRGGTYHTPDEYVELDSVLQGARVLARLITQWCG
jgi:acetylornithine deacetylase